MPANYETVQSISRIAAAALDGLQYRFVKAATDETVGLTGAGERALGVLVGKGVSGVAVDVGFSGRVLVEAGASVTAGDLAASDGSGKVITQTSTNIVLGTILETGVSGDLVSVLFQPQGAP